MHADTDTDMDTDTDTAALCPSGGGASSPVIPAPDAPTLNKRDKLLVGLERAGLSPAGGAPRRRGSMPVPYKHQLRRAQAVDELDWPPQALSSGSSDSLGSGEAAPAGRGGVFKVMLLGESGVGKSALAGTFGGLQDDNAHEPENTEDTYERHIIVDKEEVTLVVYDIWEQGESGSWLREHCLQTGDAFLIVFSVTDRRSFSKVPETLLRLRAGRPHHDLPIILVGNKSDLARSREVSLEGKYSEIAPFCQAQKTSSPFSLRFLPTSGPLLSEPNCTQTLICTQGSSFCVTFSLGLELLFLSTSHVPPGLLCLLDLPKVLSSILSIRSFLLAPLYMYSSLMHFSSLLLPSISSVIIS
ncbi:GTP-binding protein REM 2 isoform X1 [Dromiciops gliroides]|uniref:GTP-binding protein REM 2 isoform X1 n=1 Tax=Dromiciops gliroides TaxID=33562 RepID=UPI001CC608ED|nr:GTP-binding protein REM 2 isoform X1 [Dromiciops gliroides]